MGTVKPLLAPCFVVALFSVPHAGCGALAPPVSAAQPPASAPLSTSVKAALPAAKRTLRVALFPYLPDANHDGFAALTSAIEHEFEAGHPGVDVVLKPFDPKTEDFYTKDTVVGWLGGNSGESYDLVEIDTVLLGEVAGVIEPWAYASPPEDWHPAARTAAVLNGKVMAFPHMMCGHFVITRDASVAQADTAETLVAKVRKLAPTRKLVGDFGGSWNLPSLYLDAWADTNGTDKLASAIGPLDTKVVGDLRSVEHLCRIGDTDRCTDGTYHNDPKIAADELASGEAGAFVGYSEFLNEVVSKRTDAAPLYISSAPLGGGSHPILFTDGLVLRRGCTDTCQSDARAFAEYLDGPRMYEMLLMSKDAPSAKPRYLLPATRSAFKIPSVAADAYYAVFERLVANGASFPTSGLNDARGDMKKRLLAALTKK
jgi:thiamine pyridinylase